MPRLFLFALLPLVACVSPQERCIANAGNEVRVLSGLIATTQANIDRGYGIRTEDFFVNQEQVCGVVDGEQVYCNVAVADSRQVPFALDLNVERTKLQSLLGTRQELVQRADAIVGECRILYPEA